MTGREDRARPSGRHRRGTPVSQVGPRRWDTAQMARAQQLDQVEPAWAVWYGPATRHFHAAALWPGPEPLLVHATTADELRTLMREAEHTCPPRGATMPDPTPGPMPDTPDDLRAARWDVPPDPSTITKIRALVNDTLTAWALAHLTDDVVLVTGELLANAVVHGDPPVTLSLWAGADELHLQVTDHSPEQPRQLRLDTDALHGRGLTIVEALAHDSGVTPLPTTSGKTVWARWHLSPTPPETTHATSDLYGQHRSRHV